MANPPTQPDVQTVAGATQFDATTGALGLVNFAAYIQALGRSEARARILSVIYNGTGGAGVQLDINIYATGAGTTVRIPLVSEANVTTKVIMCGTGLWVPKATNGLSWNLFCVTTGKTATATLIVDWELGVS